MQNGMSKIWNPQFTRIFIASCVFYLGLQTMMSLITKYANTMTDSAVKVGLVSSAFAFSALFMKIFAGPAADTFNKKWVIFFATLLLSAAAFGYSISGSITSLIVFRLVQGTAQAFTAIALLAFASDFLPKEKMTSGIGMYSLGQTACAAVAPAFGLKMTQLFGYAAMFAACGILLIISGMLILTIKTDFVQTKRFKITLKGIAVKEAIVPAVVMGLLLMAYSIISSYLLIYADIQGVSGISLFFTVNAVVMLIARPLISKLADRYGTAKVMIPGLVVFGVSFFIISGANKLWIFLVASVAIGLSYGACQPLIQAICIKTVGPERRGSASNTNYLGFDIGNMLGPLLCGKAVDSFGYDITWKLAAIPVAMAIMILLFWRTKADEIEAEYMNHNRG